MSCATCSDIGRRGYCAPLRCYCAHKSCHAFASWAPLSRPNVTDITTRRTSAAWDQREGSTWIDSM